jgi:riboflavin kinase/FMN adenylyltransferase
MELVQLSSELPSEATGPAVTVGNFDGVHRGHQELVEATVSEARAIVGRAVVLTFDPHPARVLTPDRAPAPLMTLSQKAEALAALGVDVLAVLPFNAGVAAQSAEQFARTTLAERLRARVVVVGSNFRFGRGREGDLPGLGELGNRLGFRVREVSPLLHDGEPISSSRIRAALARGAVREARDLLGRRFFVDGSVVAGEGRGRGLGFPTANLDVDNEALPASGVYAAWCRTRNGGSAAPHRAVANLGRRPTFEGVEPTVEVHLLDFSDDLYGRQLRLEFEDRLRDERRFSGPAALAEQITRDVELARGMLAHP